MSLFRKIGRRVERFKQDVEDAAREDGPRKCPECGEPVDAGETTCPDCGADLDGD